MSGAATVDLKSYIRDIPDFPKKGIVFKDITPLLAASEAFDAAVGEMAGRYKDRGIRLVAGIESRGFIFAAAVALKLGAGFIPVRKKGKLPYKTIALSYDLEYGSDTVEVHEDAAPNGERVLLVDDLIATGGTAAASAKLLEKAGAKVEGICFLVELEFLKGREKLAAYDVRSLLTY